MNITDHMDSSGDWGDFSVEPRAASRQRQPGRNVRVSKDDAKKNDHRKVDRDDPFSIGTAIHMMTAAVRCCKVYNRGFLYQDMHRTNTRVTYLSEKFALKHFVAVLQIGFGKLEDVSLGCRKVRFYMPYMYFVSFGLSSP